jgi:hypothetical protein
LGDSVNNGYDDLVEDAQNFKLKLLPSVEMINQSAVDSRRRLNSRWRVVLVENDHLYK